MTGTFEEFASKFREQLRTSQAEPEQSFHSFWRHQPQLNFPPESIRDPDEYHGADRLNIVCTQTELPAKKQKMLVERWCRELPGLSSVRYLWFHSRVPQALFDAACALPNIEGLYVKWSGIETIESIRSLHSLKYLYLGSSASLKGIDPLRDMKSLRWLELENIKRVSDLSPVEGLSNLEGFGFMGQDGGKNTVETFAPLAKLSELRWLRLGGIHADDGSLRALAGLKKLHHLSLGNFFSSDEFARLSTQLPHDICDWFEPFKDLGGLGIKCKTCGTGKVMLSGKGRGVVCPTCDTRKFRKHVQAFCEIAPQVSAG
jgi:hypothetical protein